MSDIFELFKKISSDSTPASKEPISWIIAGLGNPGRDYEITRHNAGFLSLDVIADRFGAKIDRAKFHALCGEATIAEKRVLLMKPMTMMNSSGEAIREAAAFYKIAPENILVLVDDIYLPVGGLRVRAKGSAGGHNGLKSIIYQLNSDKFPRIRIGVGEKPHPEMELMDWVLGRFGEQDRTALLPAFDVAACGCELIIKGELEAAQQRCNSHK